MIGRSDAGDALNDQLPGQAKNIISEIFDGIDVLFGGEKRDV